MNAQLQVLAECLVELPEVALVLGDIPKRSKHFLTMFLRMTPRILFRWSVSREMFRGRVLRVYDTLHKVEVLEMRPSLSSLMNTANIELNVVSLLTG